MDLDAAVLRDPITRLAATLQISDGEMRRLLRDAAREAEHIIARYGDNFSSQVRRAQLDLARLQQEMWASIGSQTRVAIGDGVDAAAQSVAVLNDAMMAAVGGSTVYWQQAMLAQARAGIPNLISRRENGIALSDRVYRNSVLSSGRIDRMIDGMILNGASAREIASRVRGFIDPGVPGGASYAAQRLGRTELNNAFHQTSVRLGAQQPWVRGQRWWLSGSHPKPDVCNEYADNDHENLGKGVFSPLNVPGKPHPQCLCYITPVTPSRDEFIRNFKSGHYDSYLDGVGCRGVA